MTIKKLFELLTIVGYVQDGRWDTQQEVVLAIRKEKGVEVIKKKYAGFYSGFNHKKLNISVLETWSTYDECRTLHFTNVDGKLHLDATIFDGDSFSGRRTGKRFTVELILPKSFIRIIEDRIMYAFESNLEKAYENHLLGKKIDWINQLRNEVLDETNNYTADKRITLK